MLRMIKKVWGNTFSQCFVCVNRVTGLLPRENVLYDKVSVGEVKQLFKCFVSVNRETGFF